LGEISLAYTWQPSNKPEKFNATDKERISAVLHQFIEKTEKLKQQVNRFEIKAGRIYLYHLVEQFGWDNPETIFRISLIEGKYAEFPFARITVYDLKLDRCSADWQQHTGKWFNVYEGKLEDCLKYIENDGSFC
jgi:hypothetical protein